MSDFPDPFLEAQALVVLARLKSIKLLNKIVYENPKPGAPFIPLPKPPEHEKSHEIVISLKLVDDPDGKGKKIDADVSINKVVNKPRAFKKNKSNPDD